MLPAAVGNGAAAGLVADDMTAVSALAAAAGKPGPSRKTASQGARRP
jgi:hypothetical protein